MQIKMKKTISLSILFLVLILEFGTKRKRGTKKTGLVGKLGEKKKNEF